MSKCIKWEIVSHLLAIPILFYISDPILKGLILLYVFNDIHIHLGETNRIFNIWGRTIVLSLFFYVTYRFFKNYKPLRAWYISLVIYLAWMIIELLFSNSFGWFTNRESTKSLLCYEVIIHTTVWLSLYLLLILQPELRFLKK